MMSSEAIIACTERDRDSTKRRDLTAPLPSNQAKKAMWSQTWAKKETSEDRTGACGTELRARENIPRTQGSAPISNW